MAFPTTPQDMLAELYIGDAWRDITADVRATNDDPVRISRGRPSEDGTVPPSRCALKLDNKAGTYSPRNPLGTYYGTIGRNTPARVVLRVARDTFDGRTVASGWGTSSGGDAWSTFQNGGTAADFAVAAGVGTHTVGAAVTYRASYLAGVTYRDVDLAATVTLPFTNVTGGDVEPANLLLRGVSTTDYYMVRVVITTAEAVTVKIMHADGTNYGSTVTVSGLTHSSSQALRVRAQCEGQTFRAKVWAAAAGEPHDWHVTAHVDAAPRSGWVGVRTGASSGNTNVSFVASYDDVEVRSPRWAGEVSEWPTQWDLSGNDAWVSTEGRGILRRLGQGASVARSAPRAYIPTSDPGLIAYWPLEDGPLSASGLPVVGVNHMILKSDLAPSNHFGMGDMGPFLAKCVRLHGGTDAVTGWVDSPSGAASEWTVDHLRFGGRDTTSILTVSVQGIAGSFTARNWLVEFLSATDQVRVTPPGASAVTFSAPSLYDDGAHHVRFFVEQDGADVRWWVDIDADPHDTDVVAGMTLTNPYSVQVMDQSTHSQHFAVGHIAVYSGSRPLVDFATPVLGWAGETAIDRMVRLCEENNIPFAYQGLASASAAMGPQSVKTVLQLLQECADCDLGTLHESRGTIGLAYRARTSIYNQDAALTLALSALRMAQPVDDDQHVRNDVTVKQSQGSEYRIELETGPLSTADPQDGGVGRYDTSATVNVDTAGQLPDLAGWLLHLGTVDEARYPTITLDRAHASVLAQSAALLSLDVEDRLVVTDALGVGTYDDISQLVRGYTESLGQNKHLFAINCAPASPYEVIELDDADLDVLDSGSSRLASLVNSSATSFSVAVDDPDDLWTTSASDMPILMRLGGEEVSVTAISGSTSPQTFTVSRSQNGVVKGHAADTVIGLARPAILAL